LNHELSALPDRDFDGIAAHLNLRTIWSGPSCGPLRDSTVKTTMACLMLLAASSPALAQKQLDLSNPNVLRSLSELSREMLECAAFFASRAQCLKGGSAPAAASDVAESVTASNELRNFATEASRAMGTSDADLTARQKSLTDSVTKSVGTDCANIGVTVERYAAFCGQLRQNKDQRLRELIAGELCTHAYRCGP
jgi:hypothetical protein